MFRAIFLFVLLTVSAAQPMTVIGPKDYPANTNPLTGLPVANPTVLDRVPVVVKISNYPPAIRPQRGLMTADLVWEHLLAGGVTRFSAVFYSADDAQVGPVRSARLVDFAITRLYDGLFVYSGMAQGTLDVLNNDAYMLQRIVESGSPCPPLCRHPQDGLAYEHTLFADVTRARDFARAALVPSRPAGLAFSELPPIAGTPVSELDVTYHQTTIRWVWGGDSWLRYQDDVPHFDAVTGEQIRAANVVVIEDEHIEMPFVRDEYWGPPNYAFDVRLVGSGRAYLLRDGLAYEGTWLRPTENDPMTFESAYGVPLPFKPGNTFFNLVPRWYDGYELRFYSDDAPAVHVTGDTGVNMRIGPGEQYITPDVAYPGDTFVALGRNRTGDWLQLYRQQDDLLVWLPIDRVDIAKGQTDALLNPRPSLER